MESKLEDISKRLTEVLENNSKKEESIKVLTEKVIGLERFLGMEGQKSRIKGSTGERHGITEDHDEQPADGIEEEREISFKYVDKLGRARLHADSQRSVFSAVQTEDLQSEFKSIQDRYTRVAVANDLRFTGNRSGLKQQSKELSGVMINSVKYMETGLKILTHIQKRAMKIQHFK